MKKRYTAFATVININDGPKAWEVAISSHDKKEDATNAIEQFKKHYESTNIKIISSRIA